MNRERIATRLRRIRQVMEALEKKAHGAAWTRWSCCRQSKEERIRRQFDRLHEFVDSLECDVLMLSCRAS